MIHLGSFSNKAQNHGIWFSFLEVLGFQFAKQRKDDNLEKCRENSSAFCGDYCLPEITPKVGNGRKMIKNHEKWTPFSWLFLLENYSRFCHSDLYQRKEVFGPSSHDVGQSNLHGIYAMVVLIMSHKLVLQENPGGLQRTYINKLNNEKKKP